MSTVFCVAFVPWCTERDNLQNNNKYLIIRYNINSILITHNVQYLCLSFLWSDPVVWVVFLIVVAIKISFLSSEWEFARFDHVGCTVIILRCLGILRIFVLIWRFSRTKSCGTVLWQCYGTRSMYSVLRSTVVSPHLSDEDRFQIGQRPLPTVYVSSDI